MRPFYQTPFEPFERYSPYGARRCCGVLAPLHRGRLLGLQRDPMRGRRRERDCGGRGASRAAHGIRANSDDGMSCAPSLAIGESIRQPHITAVRARSSRQRLSLVPSGR